MYPSWKTQWSRAETNATRSTSCWMSSCWPSASVSSWWRWVTPTPANGFRRTTMIFDYSLAAIVSAGLLFYLTYALLRPEQHWLTYTVAMLLFHVGGFLIIYAVMRLQAVLPFNPADQSAVAPDLSFNTAISFITNTNWQNYGGESTVSYLVQMLGLTHQNFLSAATGIALAVALIRGFSRSSMRTIGNFGVDVTRCTHYVHLPN